MQTSKMERHDGGPDRYVCENCASVWDFAKLDDISDLGERIEAGDTMPAGECPVCDALCYPTGGRSADEDQLDLFDGRERHDDDGRESRGPARLQEGAGRMTTVKIGNNLYELSGFVYDTCRVCGEPVSAEREQYARRQVENAHCGSPACTRRELLERFACCLEAEVLPCVCAYAFRCAIHGDRHIGTHD